MRDLAAYYRWEFLRRNPRYRKDYAALRQKLGMDPRAFEQQNHRAWLALYVSTAEEAQRIFPGTDFDIVRAGFVELGRFQEKWRVNPVSSPEDFFSSQASDIPSVGEANSDTQPGILKVLPPEGIVEKERQTNWLYVAINPEAPQKELLQRFEDVLNIQNNIRAIREFGLLKDPRWARFEQSLEIYDEIESQGHSREAAAEKLFPEFKNLPADEQAKWLKLMDDLLEEARHHVEAGLP